MKNLLITTLPVLIIIFIIVWTAYELKYAILVTITIPTAVMLGIAIVKWIEFIDDNFT
jgi:Cu/Ag efflux pump CusA